MERQIDRMVQDFERGRLSRRDLVGSLSLLLAAAAGGRAAAAGTTPFQAVGLNHIALSVTDVGRSRDFYVQLLGLSVARESESSCFLTCGDHFVALFRSRQSGMDHYCYAVENYSVQEAAEKLRSRSLEPRISGNRIYFSDPDGLTVQLAASGHRP